MLNNKFVYNTDNISCKNLPDNYQIFYPIDQRNFMNSNKKVIVRYVDNNIYTYQYQRCLKN